MQRLPFLKLEFMHQSKIWRNLTFELFSENIGLEIIWLKPSKNHIHWHAVDIYKYSSNRPQWSQKPNKLWSMAFWTIRLHSGCLWLQKYLLLCYLDFCYNLKYTLENIFYGAHSDLLNILAMYQIHILFIKHLLNILAMYQMHNFVQHTSVEYIGCNVFKKYFIQHTLEPVEYIGCNVFIFFQHTLGSVEYIGCNVFNLEGGEARSCYDQFHLRIDLSKQDIYRRQSTLSNLSN